MYFIVVRTDHRNLRISVIGRTRSEFALLVCKHRVSPSPKRCYVDIDIYKAAFEDLLAVEVTLESKPDDRDERHLRIQIAPHRASGQASMVTFW